MKFQSHIRAFLLSSPRSPSGFRPPPTGKYASRLTEALKGHEKDVPHKNVSRIKEFQAFFQEFQGRARTLETDAGTGNLQKGFLAYGRVLEVCVSCHAKFRD